MERGVGGITLITRIIFTCTLLLLPSLALAGFQGRVITVNDGDTIKVLRPDNSSVTIRLAEIDSPELSQDFGREAKRFTYSLAYGKTVMVEEKDKDRYGRTVAVVYLPDGTSLNELVVRNGYAWQYRQYSHSARLAALEGDARAARVGLWQGFNPEPPWTYRHEREDRRHYRGYRGYHKKKSGRRPHGV